MQKNKMNRNKMQTFKDPNPTHLKIRKRWKKVTSKISATLKELMVKITLLITIKTNIDNF